MQFEECIKKLSNISGYCCAQKDKDSLFMAMQALRGYTEILEKIKSIETGGDAWELAIKDDAIEILEAKIKELTASERIILPDIGQID